MCTFADFSNDSQQGQRSICGETRPTTIDEANRQLVDCGRLVRRWARLEFGRFQYFGPGRGSRTLGHLANAHTVFVDWLDIVAREFHDHSCGS